MTGISINIFIRNEKSTNAEAEIYYYNLGNELKQKQKIFKLKNLISVENLIKDKKFKKVKIDKYGDWFNHRDPNLEKN